MANCGGYKRHSLSVLNSSPYLDSGDPIDDVYRMPEVHLYNPRKRQLSEQRLLPVNEVSQPRSKRQKLSHPSESQPPVAFWDNLSKIWLTKCALRELNRRNTAPSPPPLSYQRPHRPVTRRAHAEPKKHRAPIQSATDFLCHCGPRCLKDIKLFARHGGPDLSKLKGYPEPINLLNHTKSSSRPTSRCQKRGSTSTLSTKPTTNITKSTGPYNRNFQQNLIDNGVYPYAYEYPSGRIPAKPNNWEEIKQALAQPRPSLSPSKFSEEAHEKFIRADAHAFKEKQVTTSVIPTIEGEIRDAKCVSGGIPFTNLDHLTDSALVPGNPDLYYGARPEQLDRRVRDELNSHIIPSTQDDLPITPNFLLAVKGPDGSLAVAGRQASYDGALGARGIQSLQSYRQDKPVYNNNTYTITSIYQGGHLKIYTSHPTQPTSPEGRPEYHMTQLRSFAMTDTAATFRQGAAAFRNMRDWAKEQRDNVIACANKRANDHQAGALAVDTSDFSLTTSFASEALLEPCDIEPLIPESRTSPNEDSNTETSTDELTLDSRAPTKRSSGLSKQPHSQRKRRIVGESSGTGRSDRLRTL